MRTATVVILVVGLLALPACQMNERMSGTAFGGTGGAILGAVLAETVAGALIGGVAGGVIGYIVGDYLADRRERCSPPCQPNPCAPQGYSYPAPAAYPQPQYQPQYQPQPCAPTTYVAPTPRVGGVKAVARSRTASDAWLARGKQAGTLPQAIEAYERAAKADATNAEAWNALGLARQAAADHAGARTAFERALAADPGHWAAKQNLAWMRSEGR